VYVIRIHDRDASGTFLNELKMLAVGWSLKKVDGTEILQRRLQSMPNEQVSNKVAGGRKAS
jgi:hypothetical protein